MTDEEVSQSLVVDAYRAVFGMPTIEASDHFLELGGDSLMAAEICVRIEDATGQPVPLMTIFEESTPRALAACLQKEQAISNSSSSST